MGNLFRSIGSAYRHQCGLGGASVLAALTGLLCSCADAEGYGEGAGDAPSLEAPLSYLKSGIRRESVSSTGAQLDGSCGDTIGGLSLDNAGSLLLFTEKTGTVLPIAADSNKSNFDLYGKVRSTGALTLMPGASVEGYRTSISRRAVSGTARYVAAITYRNSSPAMTHVMLWDRTLKTSVSVDSWPSSWEGAGVSISRNGNYLAYVDGTGTLTVYDRVTKQKSYPNAGMGGRTIQTHPTRELAPVLSADGNVIVFSATCSNVDSSLCSNSAAQLWAYDRTRGTTTLVSRGDWGVGDRPSLDPDISDDGRVIVFQSKSGNLAQPFWGGGAGAIFAYDRERNLLTLLTRQTADGLVQPDGFPAVDSYGPSISADGNRVAFFSYSTMLLPGDTSIYKSDVFVLDRTTMEIVKVSRSSTGTEGNAHSNRAVISPNGKLVCFTSQASNLVSGDSNGTADVFCRPLNNGHVFQGHTYEYFTGRRSWDSAKAYCESLGAHLVTVGSAVENQFVSRIVPAGSQVWLGFTDVAQEGNWRWVTDEAASYTNWQQIEGDWTSSEPNDYAGIEEWAALYSNGVHGSWNDVPASWSLGSVCEWDTLAP